MCMCIYIYIYVYIYIYIYIYICIHIPCPAGSSPLKDRSTVGSTFSRLWYSLCKPFPTFSRFWYRPFLASLFLRKGLYSLFRPFLASGTVFGSATDTGHMRMECLWRYINVSGLWLCNRHRTHANKRLAPPLRSANNNKATRTHTNKGARLGRPPLCPRRVL